MQDNQRFTILIVDDIAENVKVLGRTLREKSYNVEFSLNGHDALKWLENQAFDLVLLDIMMPVMDGYQVLKKIKSNPQTANIPVIFITAKSDMDSIVKGLKMGAVDYITKPFNSTELMLRVKTHLRLRESTQLLKQKNKDLYKSNRAILDSISYASRIQQAALPQVKFISEILSEHFVFFKPRDIVSGDFYWFKQIENKAIIVVGDCTGHGVPGAFMSMLGLTYLSEIAAEIEELSPKMLLEKLNNKIVKSLKQESNEINIRDAIELSVCVLDYESKEVKISGIGSTLFFLISQENLNLSNYDKNVKRYTKDSSNLYYFKNESLHSAKVRKKTKISEFQFTLKEGDTIYMSSDGFIDQIGGNRRRKYLRKRFIEFLLDMYQEPFSEQSKRIEQEYQQWKGDLKQIDDILVLGFRIQDEYGELDLF